MEIFSSMILIYAALICLCRLLQTVMQSINWLYIFYNSILYFFQSVRERPYPDEERVKGDAGRDLAIIHHLCETHILDLQSMAKTQVPFSLTFT
jgi:hypothetical protein